MRFLTPSLLMRMIPGILRQQDISGISDSCRVLVLSTLMTYFSWLISFSNKMMPFDNKRPLASITFWLMSIRIQVVFKNVFFQLLPVIIEASVLSATMTNQFMHGGAHRSLIFLISQLAGQALQLYVWRKTIGQLLKLLKPLTSSLNVIHVDTAKHLFPKFLQGSSRALCRPKMKLTKHAASRPT